MLLPCSLKWDLLCIYILALRCFDAVYTSGKSSVHRDITISDNRRGMGLRNDFFC